MSAADLRLDAQSGASQDDNITISLSNTSIGLEEGKHSSPGHENATRDLSTTGANPLGTGDQTAKPFQASLSIEDVQMNLDEVQKRFINATRMRLKAKVQGDYIERFSRMVKAVSLEDYTKRQLAGTLGKRLILEHINNIPKPSVLTNLAAIKSVWMAGIGLPWPIDNKMDLGKLPKTGRETTPPDGPIKEWANALSREKDPYLRLIWLLIAQHGWRPSHATGVRWSDIRYDAQGHPVEILASGKGGEFKTFAPVAVHLWPDVMSALEEWRKVHPSPNGTAWILPHRGLTGRFEVTRRMESRQLGNHWKVLKEKYKLPELKPKDMRHWVSTACRKVGLSKAASAYLQGHDADGGTSMRDWYDNPQLEDIYLEQMERFPNGPLGALVPLEVELVSDIPQEGIGLLRRYLAGEIGIMNLMTSIESVKMKIEAEARPAGVNL